MTIPNEPRQTSEARINANRENAKKSTGPRSPAGKASSSRNRLLHGLCANKHILLGDDNPDDFLLLLKDLDNTFRPVGEAEEMLVTRIAADMWRLEHAIPFEAGIFRERLQCVDAGDYRRNRERINRQTNHARNPDLFSPAPDPPDPGDRLARVFMGDCDKPNYLTSLNRYKSAIQLSIDRNLRQFKIYQAARIASQAAQKEPAGHATPPAEPEPPSVGPPVPPAKSAAPQAESAVTLQESANYYSNPTIESTANFGVTALLFAILALLQAVPEFFAARAGLRVAHVLGFPCREDPPRHLMRIQGLIL